MIEKITDFIRKNSNTILVFLAITLLYFILRLTNIMSLPIFTDEAIYVRWAQIANQDPAQRFISLTDGKQPSFIWAGIVMLRVISDPLLALRLVSVLAGFLSTIGMFFAAKELFSSKKAGIFACLLYVLYPFALVYDRMALYDTLVAMFSIWALYLHVRLIKSPRLDLAFILSMVLGGGLLTKSNALFSIYLLPFSTLLFDAKQKKRREKILKWILFAGISSIFAYAIYSILRLSPLFYIIDQKTDTFIYSFNDWLDHPLRFFIGNMRGLLDWTGTYLTIPGIILVGLALLLGKKKYIKQNLLLLIWFAAPITALALFGKVLYPRFIFFMTIPLILMASLGLHLIVEKGKKTWIKIMLIVLFTALFARADYLIITNFARAPIAKPDLDQYINSWPAGGGVEEMITFFNQESKDKQIFVATEGIFGSLPTWTVEIYLDKNQNIEKQGFYPVPNEIPEEFLQTASQKTSYVVFNETQEPPQSWPIELVKEYAKGQGTDKLRIYKITSQ